MGFYTAGARPPADFEALRLAREGVGPNRVRALALASGLIFRAPSSTRAPARDVT